VTAEPAATGLQRLSAGDSSDEIHAAALTLSQPRAGLRWIDIGAGRGDVLRAVRDRWEPASLVAVDLLPWLADDLLGDVDVRVGEASEVASSLAPADRVLCIETLEHLEAPWLVLRQAARLVAPGGRIVVSTPNIQTLRHRLELAVRGRLTSFRPDEPQHLTPILGHVMQAVLEQEEMRDVRRAYVCRDVIPFTGGRTWPGRVAERAGSLLCVSLFMSAARSSADG
jgi:2-polyprenyl-3-methyl-5-hydroxy-6-metoxy-1,4-benzoquinol methylase